MQRHAVPRSVRNAEQAVLAFGLLYEEIGRGPVHVLDQEAVRQGADDMDRNFVDQVRRELHAVGGAELSYAQRFRKAVRTTNVWHREVQRLAVEELEVFAEDHSYLGYSRDVLRRWWEELRASELPIAV